MRTTCRLCGHKTLVSGWEWCETCASSADHRQQLSVSVLADQIVRMDQLGIPWAEQFGFMLQHGIDKKRIDAAQAAALSRYQAVEMKRPRASKGW